MTTQFLYPIICSLIKMSPAERPGSFCKEAELVWASFVWYTQNIIRFYRASVQGGGIDMIYTVTFNPSIDYIVTVRDFMMGVVNRTSREIIFPGGKGINVSMVLKNLG